MPTELMSPTLPTHNAHGQRLLWNDPDVEIEPDPENLGGYVAYVPTANGDVAVVELTKDIGVVLFVLL